ncbi:hypothetical protein D9756_008268 [Leucocoprinus leucothites]|uniref:Nephrocystin 3-like N-terminal domain-containing protein n=1 Tax=Leucocoprinus leucothites TaxID=201217 RepID=A0A8H5D0R5_9AGAR|nr:hypothetical protein D9756_008268 [Leucoagaricus leucothites]
MVTVIKGVTYPELECCILYSRQSELLSSSVSTGSHFLMTTVLSASIRNFEGAHDIVINDQTIVDHSSHVYNVKKTRERPGLSKLLEYSMREAFHDSSGRWPPPRCHYDSRQELRTTITNWGTGKSDTIREILLWMHGPFGVGKSAVAQSCAEALAAENKLRASLFFSRPNGRNNPNRVFTSIAYQLALKCPLLGDILDHEILKNPTLLTAAHPLQFQELLVAPLRQVKPQGIDIEGWVVILDGLDEVDDTNAQCDLLNIIAASIRDHTTPLRWFILSRLEPHIQRAMRAHGVLPLSHSLELPLSLEDDHEILTFFVKELHKIGEQHDLPPSWCSEADIAALVKLAQGLWIYVSTVTRFIGDPNSLGPPTQLRLVLSLAQKQSKPLATNPLATMDLFYNLIMQQIPPHVSLIIRKILLLREVCPDATNEVDQSRGTVRVVGLSKLANVLGLSEKELHNACIFLQSVLFLQQSVVGDPMDIRFYHASFMEYMEDSTRSKDFCIYGDDCLDYLRQEIIERINEAHSHSTGM